MKTLEQMRAVADHALAENESGVVAGQQTDQLYLTGVEDALRWATGDEAAHPSVYFMDLLRRMDEVQAAERADGLVMVPRRDLIELVAEAETAHPNSSLGKLAERMREALQASADRR